MCSSQVKLWTFKSSTNAFKNLSIYAPKTLVMVSKKVLVAFFMPKGMIVQLNGSTLVIKIDLRTSFGAILIYQNLDYKSNVENHCDLFNWVKTSSTRGIRNESQHVWRLNGL